MNSRLLQRPAVALLTAVSILFAAPCSASAAEWPQTHSDLRADPAVLFGTLPNGMRYAIMHNAMPKGAVAMRLCIDAGSMEETDAQQGLAHFLEHMAFRGSRHVPEDQVWPQLQRLGLAFGADTNASTGWTQTEYQFNFPHNDAPSIDTGLMRLREIASELTLSQTAMDSERGVVLSEERLRDTPDYRALKQVVQQAVPGTIAASRFPIGKTDIIAHAPVSLIRDFYHAYYRPERAVVIVVGDIDPKTIEAKIKSRFGDWKGTGPAGTEPRQPAPSERGPEAKFLVDTAGPANLYLDWVGPKGPNTKAQARTELYQLLGLVVLNYRLQVLANGPQHPFVPSFPNDLTLFHAAELHLLSLATSPKNWRLALSAAITGVRRLLEDGINAEELTRAVANIRAAVQQAAATAGARTSPSLADALAKSVDERTVFQSPAEELALADEMLKGLTPATASAALGQLMRGHGPLVLLTSPTPIEGGQAAVTAALNAAEKAPFSKEAAEAAVVWPYTSFGVPGTVVDHKETADLGTTFVRFANGVRLTVKPTSFTPGAIEVNVAVGDGRVGLPPDHNSPAWAIAAQGLVFSGLKAIGFDDINRAMTGREVLVEAALGDGGLLLHGRTRPTDFASELQLLAAYVSAPGWRTEGIERARAVETNKLVHLGESPTGVYRRDFPGLLHNGDRRWSSPTRAEVAALDLNAFKHMLEAQLTATPIEITVVGDITVDHAVQAVAGTFGALPHRPTAAAPKGAPVRFPAATQKPVELHHQGRSDQGVAVIAWPTTDLFNRRDRESLTVLKEVVGSRILEQLRSQAGATYSPATRESKSTVFPGYGYFLVETELPPAKMPLFFNITQAITANVRAHPVSADELERARNPILARDIADRQTNDFWVFALTDAQRDPRRLDAIRDEIPDLKGVTAADVQRTAQTYLTDAKAWKAMIVPTTAAPMIHEHHAP